MEQANTGVADAARETIADGLARLLADTYSIYLMSHGYHWNVTGPMFPSLHAMFEEQYTELAGAVDEVAERIRALGLPAPAGYVAFTRLSSVALDAEDDLPEALEMVRRLGEAHETVARTARELVATAEAADDVATADLATQRVHVHEKTAWMLRATAA